MSVQHVLLQVLYLSHHELKTLPVRGIITSDSPLLTKNELHPAENKAGLPPTTKSTELREIDMPTKYCYHKIQRKANLPD
ncbi:MAG: hypothetical protein GXY48_01870 [Methanomicrobiales archaeon]|nr:hypothetical protein [Methanomicrobiales archaeon]